MQYLITNPHYIYYDTYFIHSSSFEKLHNKLSIRYEKKFF